jgi:hypothetical protein
MMEAVRTSETSVDNNFTRQYNPEDSSEHHTRRRENFKSHSVTNVYVRISHVPQFWSEFFLQKSVHDIRGNMVL